MEFHAEGLRRMMDIVFDSGGASRADAFASDSLVSSMLLLHDLHPLDLHSRVERALDVPEFRARGASVELKSILDGVVRVRVEGGPQLRSAVETALMEAAPDALSIQVDGEPVSAGFVPLGQLTAR
jgi:hypothetical protein